MNDRELMEALAALATDTRLRILRRLQGTALT